jgi:hypothetical protein
MLPREVTVSMDGMDLAAGSTHELELRMPRTLNLRDLGMSPDPRDLGPGIISIAFCARADCGDHSQ